MKIRKLIPKDKKEINVSGGLDILYPVSMVRGMFYGSKKKESFDDKAS